FRVTNSTRSSVTITGRYTSCACTSSDLATTKLRSGESTDLQLKVVLPQSLADRELQCTLLTDHPRFPNWQYVMRVQTVPPVRIEPPSIMCGDITAPGTAPEHHANLELFTYESDPHGLPSITKITSPSNIAVKIGGEPNTERLENGIRC